MVRRRRSWYRWVTLAMLAHAFLVVVAVTERAGHPAPSGLVGLTCNKIQHRCAALVIQPVADADSPVALVGLATPTSGTSPRPPLPPAANGP